MITLVASVIFMMIVVLGFFVIVSTPQFNFVGKLLGPKGNSMKRLQVKKRGSFLNLDWDAIFWF